ncbi:Beige 1 [Grifola frondosa]|uniref:Beige 1 n=1 Tax=Grifola frondosa TaxID=5627 RepID=A0A1C7MNB5_GRIFR|nr:Beige 1 [Grifola frondosa]
MLRTLLTPLSARFSLSPLSSRQESVGIPEHDDLAPENFARDVIVELMRNAVERLKAAEELHGRIEKILNISSIPLEYDLSLKLPWIGFQTTRPYNRRSGSWFLWLSTTLHGLQFLTSKRTSYAEVDQKLQEFNSGLGLIHEPESLLVLYNSLSVVPEDGSIMRYFGYKLLERLSTYKHRNHCVLNGLGLVNSLFQKLCDSKSDIEFPKPERQVVQKLLRKLLDLGATTDEARLMFQRVVRSDNSLDPDVLEVLRAGMKVRWPEHFSLESSAALRISHDGSRVLPSTGFTFMLWLWIEQLPKQIAYCIFSVHAGDHIIFSLKVRPDGMLECQSTGSQVDAVFHTALPKSRWAHIALVHYPHRASNPTLRLFVDGSLTDSVNWSYPKTDLSTPRSYVIGDNSSSANMSWCIASSYLISSPLPDGIPLFIHHLGPRYVALFQSADIIKFLTYEASAALNIYVAGRLEQQRRAPSDLAHLVNSIKNGLGISESAILFAVSPASLFGGDSESAVPGLTLEGDIVTARCNCLDLAMWKIGGAAVPLRLVQLANNPHELSRALGILTDGLRNSWQNSEDMERLRGYDILADLLRSKSQLINMTGFETLFEFLGMNFRSPDHSAITNTVAYDAIALDFQLWSRTRQEIQILHLEHFATLLYTSKHKRFNSKQCIAKMGVVRKLLFVLQTEWYHHDALPLLLDAIKTVAEATFSSDNTIKPIVSYLAANLPDAGTGAASPRSIISRIDYRNAQSKAEEVLKLLVSILETPSAFTKFTASLPLTRICLLLLGDHPSSLTATQILHIIGTALNRSSSFGRKFELVSGWNVLKLVLPNIWDESVQDAVFDVLLGEGRQNKEGELIVACPHIVPTIFSALRTGLESITMRRVDDERDRMKTQSAVERLLEELINIHSSSTTFRQIFKSHVVTQSFIDSYKLFVTAVSTTPEFEPGTTRVLEKLSHFGLSIALDNAVASSQKQEIMDVLQLAEAALNPRSSQETALDTIALVGGRPRRRRMTSVRLSVQLGESAVKRSTARIHDWRKAIIATEKKRLRKTVLDLREHHRQVSVLTEWSLVLTTERGLWAKDHVIRLWRLDETEGPYRVRKKLEPDHEKIFSSKRAEKLDQLEEDIVEDKHRRVRHELEPGDVIEAAKTVARISGVDSSRQFPELLTGLVLISLISIAGLLIFGRTHLYMLDGLVENEDGEVIDAHDAPRQLFFVPGSIVDLDGPQRAQRWQHDQIMSCSDRTFLFRDVALEIYFRDSRSLLVVFVDKKHRQEITHRLSSIMHHSIPEPNTPGFLKSPLVGRLSARVTSAFSAKMLSGFGLDELSTAQRKWQSREISNFTYLSILNQVSGRTPSDATQYPVFPWVLSDYTSTKLDLSSWDSSRDLTLPMGALTLARQEAARSRYDNLLSVGEKPFHYGTHFSSSMIVCHFLIRLEPYTHMFKTLQGGDWDLPDRLFSDISRAYISASQDIRGDVRELIPEFFCCPEFLENSANLDFGVQQNTGEKIHHVKLPPWANQDPLLFIVMNREALESDYVSEHLPKWIDLIWGCKQRDAESLNLFHPLSYEGAIDLDSITDELEREATVGIIHNFGQTPRKIFSAPHPQRNMHGNSALPLGLGLNQPVRELVVDLIGQQIMPCGAGVLCVPSRTHEQIEWDGGHASSGEIKVVVDRKVVQVVEAAFCCCAAFADSDTLVTGSTDHMVRLWRISRNGHGPAPHRSREHPMILHLTHIMRAHTSQVICVTASRGWSLVVSGSKDGSVALWDLNRGAYIRSIWHGHGENAEVHLATINESTGYIATCSRERLWLHTINARPIASLDLAITGISHIHPPISSMAFLERDYSHVGLLATGAPDGTITLRTWNADNTPEGEKAKWEFHTLTTLKVKSDRHSRGSIPCVTALKFVGESLYHGEDTGKVYNWELPD